MSSSPVSPMFPTIPPKDTANDHPYAIRTSSSAVLTRSSSTGNKSATTHRYNPPVPISPKSSRIRYVPRKHSYSSSSKDVPPPVPIPPSISGIVSDGEGVPPTPPLSVRTKRRESMPQMTHARSDSESVLEELPPNPKIWTPAQLATYLSSALRLRGGAQPPALVSRDIGTFVVKNRLNGRTFLRMKRPDYENLDLNPLWKDWLSDASRTLRQSSVHNRIMGTLTSASLSVDDLGRLRNRNDSDEDEDENDILPATYSRISSDWKNDANKKRTLGRASLRPGRVRGMVQNFERSASGSEASASGSEYDESERIILTQDMVEQPQDLPSLHEPTSSEDSVASPLSAVEPGPTPGGQLNIQEMNATIDTSNDEPSIEELLMAEPEAHPITRKHTSWGAKAWEERNASDIAYITARKIPLGDAPTDSMHKTSETMEPAVLTVTELFQDTPGVHPDVSQEKKTVEPTKREASVDTADNVELWRRDVNVGTEGLTPVMVREMSVGTDEVAAAPPEVGKQPPEEVYKLLESFQQRLERVEQRLDELERREAEHELAQRVSTSERVAQAIKEVYEMEDEEFIEPLKREKEPGGVPTGETETAEHHPAAHENYIAPDPTTIGGLPGYVLLVSVGVVALTMRVVLNRVWGGRRR